MFAYEGGSQCPQESLGQSELVRVVSEKDGVYMIVLPEGVTPGRWEAAEEFAKAVAILHAKAPGCAFVFTSFDYESTAEFHAVKSWLAVKEPVVPRRQNLLDRMLVALSLPPVMY